MLNNKKITSQSQNVLMNSEEVFVLTHELIKKLKVLAESSTLKRARICLHEDLNNSVHEMVIVSHVSSVVKPHKHPRDKPESYHVIEGQLGVDIFNDRKETLQSLVLSSSKHPKMYRITGDVWHQPRALTDWVVYHEVAAGPFKKQTDVIFWDAN